MRLQQYGPYYLAIYEIRKIIILLSVNDAKMCTSGNFYR